MPLCGIVNLSVSSPRDIVSSCVRACTPPSYFLDCQVRVCNALLKFCLMRESVSSDMFNFPPHGHTRNPASIFLFMNSNADSVLSVLLLNFMQLAIACFMNFLRGFLSECCPWVSPFSLHVLLVFVIPRSANCDSLMELGRSLTFAILLSVSQGIGKMSEFL